MTLVNYIKYQSLQEIREVTSQQAEFINFRKWD